MDEVGRRIKVRLAALNLTQRAIIPLLEARLGRRIAVTELSNAITGGGGIYPRHVKIRMAVNAVLDEIEKEREQDGKNV